MIKNILAILIRVTSQLKSKSINIHKCPVNTFIQRNETQKNNKMINDDDDDDEEVIEEKEEDSNDKIVNEIDDIYQVLDDESEEIKITSKRIFGNFDENEDDHGHIKDARKAFFENEAELSGSEADSDENFEGESNDEELVYSGDEDQDLPSDGEIKDELANIYL